VDEWYISMDELRKTMMDVTKKINWIPEFGMKRELDWLKNMDDWLISKKRFWGLALPIWECEKCGHFTVIKDKEMLKEKAIEGFDEFEGHTPHRPYVDKVKIKCDKCGGTMSRIEDVGNPWLDAGIVPFSTLNYRTDKKYWREWFPADFVTECFPGQFKNWFYSLIAMSSALEGKPPFKNLLGHGLVKDEHGKNMHKSTGNAIWFDDAVEEVGADVLRWNFLRHNPENDLWFGYKMTDDVRKNFFLMYWNSYKYLITYANLHDWKPSENNSSDMDLDMLDKWIISRLHNTIKAVDEGLEQYDSMAPALAIEEFVKDLSTWYIRRSRGRFASGDRTALEVLYYVVKSLNKIIMPFMPFVTEEIHQNLKTDKDVEFVQLEDFPVVEESLIDEDLESQMDFARTVSSLGQALRVENALKLRQPLSKVEISGIKSLDQEYQDIIKEELNVKEIDLVKKVKDGKNWVKSEADGVVVSLNTDITAELKKEGLAREISRQIQNERKNVGLNVGDPVDVTVVSGDSSVKESVEAFQTDIKNGVYAKNLDVKNKSTQKSTKDHIFVTIR
jgi:isoleucyl-tRNA synthetase